MRPVGIRPALDTVCRGRCTAHTLRTRHPTGRGGRRTPTSRPGPGNDWRAVVYVHLCVSLANRSLSVAQEKPWRLHETSCCSERSTPGVPVRRARSRALLKNNGSRDLARRNSTGARVANAQQEPHPPCWRTGGMAVGGSIVLRKSKTAGKGVLSSAAKPSVNGVCVLNAPTFQTPHPPSLMEDVRGTTTCERMGCWGCAGRRRPVGYTTAAVPRHSRSSTNSRTAMTSFPVYPWPFFFSGPVAVRRAQKLLLPLFLCLVCVAHFGWGRESNRRPFHHEC